MSDGFSGEFVPPGHVNGDFKPQADNVAAMREESTRHGIGRADDGTAVSLGQTEPAVKPPFAAVRPIRSAPVPQSATRPTRPTDPKQFIRERLAEVDMDLAELRVAIARVKGLEVEKRQLKRALEAFDKE